VARTPADAPASPTEPAPLAPDLAVPASEPVPTWRYDGPPGRQYTTIPITVDPGDVLAWPQVPADDGAWSRVDWDLPTRLPDNHRDDPDHRNTPEG
jgi:hypothetical protein